MNQTTGITDNIDEAGPRRSSRAASRRLKKALALEDFEALARAHLPRPIFGYVSGGAETCSSLHDNRSAFSEFCFITRTLVDVTRRTQKRSLFGTEYRSPFGIAPMGFSALSAYRGDIALARGAALAGIPMVMSGASLIPLEVVGREAPHAWFQAYLPGEVETILPMLQRVERAGFGTLVITVDFPVAGNRENTLRSGFSAPLKPSLRLAWDGIVRPRWTFGTFLRTLALHGVPHLENMTLDRGPSIVARNIVRQVSVLIPTKPPLCSDMIAPPDSEMISPPGTGALLAVIVVISSGVDVKHFGPLSGAGCRR